MQESLHQSSARHSAPTLVRAVLLPGLAAMFGLTSLGTPLAVLPVRIDADLGFGPVVAGGVLAAEGLATLITRPFVGRIADRRGAREAVAMGLWAAGGSGLFYLLAGMLPVSAIAALALMVLGRIVMGVGQGFLFSGGTTWAAILAGPAQQGRAMSWIGLLFYVGISAGTLLGGAAGNVAALLADVLPGNLAPDGFATAALITMLASLGGLAVMACTRQTPPVSHDATTLPLTAMLRAIWHPSLGFGLAAMTYIGTTTFVVLTFLSRGWNEGPLALTAFVAAFGLARPVFSGICDRARGPGAILVALGALIVGMLTLGLAPHAGLAIAGAVTAGSAMSMTYPLLVLPVVRAVPASQIGLAIGLFDASYDVAALITPPLAGLIASTAGYSAVFVFLAGVGLVAMVPAVAAWKGQPRAPQGDYPSN